MDSPEVENAPNNDGAPPPRVMDRSSGVMSVVKKQVDQGAVARPVGAGVQRAGADNLPVLEAFHEFIDKERARVRKSIRAICGVFVTVILLVAGGAFAAGYFVVDHLRSEMANDRAAVESVRADVAGVSEELAAQEALLASEIREHDDKLADGLTRIDEIDSGITEAAADIKGLKKRTGYLMTELEQVNADLTGDLTFKLAVITNELALLAMQDSSLRDEIARIQSAPAWPDEEAASPARNIPMYVTPSNSKGTISWRLPMPPY